MEENALISVIVPIYNVEAYLEQCVDSILNQTYKNLEVILVDDGSPDRCGMICDSYAAKDSRIVVVHKENGGLSDARNTGIDIAKGKYLTFVDSDDYLALDCIECLYQNLQIYDADISVISMDHPSEHDFKEDDRIAISECMGAEQAIVEMLHAGKFPVSACGKLYPSESFCAIRFPQGKWYEDLFTIYKIVMKARKVAWTNQVGYFYVTRPGSIMHSGFSMKCLHMLEALDEMKQMLPMENQQIAKAYASLTMECIVTILAHRPDKAIVKEYGVWERGRKYRFGVIMDQNAPKRARLWSVVSYFGPEILAAVMNSYYKGR